MRGADVAAAWKAGEKGKGSHMDSDGLNVFSYSHQIGYTASDGRKVGIDCHYSQSTTEHAGKVCTVADEVRPCPHHPAERGMHHRVTVDAAPEVTLRWRGW